MQPGLLRRQLRAILRQDIDRPEHRAPSKVLRIDRDNPRILLELLREVGSDVLSMACIVVDRDEGRADVGLAVEVGEAEAREG